MSRYITTKADFTLRRKHKKGSGATIYENDYTTINPMPNAMKGEYVIGDSNFVFTSRLGINGQKKHVRGKFVAPPESTSTDQKIAWMIDNMPDTEITDETKIRLKPNYTSIKDFVCYGSAVKLIQGTVNGIITDFPAEMWFSTSEIDEVKLYEANNGVGFSFNECDEAGNPKEPVSIERLVYNEYGIDMLSTGLQASSVYNPERFLCLCGMDYTLITVDESGSTAGEYPFTGFKAQDTSSGSCYEGKSIEVDRLAIVTLNFSGKEFDINVYRDNSDGSVFYTYSGNTPTEIVNVLVTGQFVQEESEGGEGGDDGDSQDNDNEPLASLDELLGAHIRPSRKTVERYFSNCDDFTAVLLDRTTNPPYKSVFETPRETDRGFVYDMVSYTWPTLHGGYNPDLSGPYYSYVDSLMPIAEFYDEYYSDNMWRSLTHEAIKALDWTYVSNDNGEIEDMSKIDTSRVEPITKIYGRQFDDLKRYADGIKSINTITYNQKSNIPDYNLSDILENSGWETKTIKITNDNDLRTESLYSGLSSGYTASDANNEFFRRLKLNSNYLLSAKGTRKGLDAMLAMFGFNPEEYDIHEYVCVFSGDKYPHFCKSTEGLDLVKYPLAKDITTINKYKISFNAMDPYGDYCGIPVAEVGCMKDGKDCSYVVPWYSQDKKYDDGLYFQMYGGWGKKESMEVSLDIAPDVTEITDLEGEMPLYSETQARLKFAGDFDGLLQAAYAESHKNDVFYVTDITKITSDYSAGDEEDITGASHYFVLENEEYNQFLGYSEEAEAYGWRSISISEIQDPQNFSAGTLVLYLESIKDDTTGNNPHVGNGLYDGGNAYIESMSQIFNYSLINRNFIGIDDGTCGEIAKFTFDVDTQEDNRKCWFFTDGTYNEKYGKYVVCKGDSDDDKCCKVDEAKSEKIEFREVDVTDLRCACEHGDDTGCCEDYGGRCTEFANYDIEDLLADAEINASGSVGSFAESYMYQDSEDIYTRGSELTPFDPEDDFGPNGEAAANSIVNVKKLLIHFNLKKFMEACEEGTNCRLELLDYIQTSVIPYLTQMIPSTTILEWTYTFGDTVLTEVIGKFEQGNE